MTSINLVSPKGSADNFKVRFREPIVINPNSKIYLNYAHLTRLNEVIFDKDQTITLRDPEFIPNVQPSLPISAPTLTTNTITIPAINPSTKRRAYTVSQLESTIKNQIDALIASNPELNIYSTIQRLDTGRDQSSFLTGLFLDDNFTKLPYVSFNADTTHQKDAGSGADVNDIDCAYFKSSATNANPRYDSYALSDTHFFHFAAQCMGNKSQVVSGTFLKIKTNVKMNAQQGNICVALYSKEIADQPSAFSHTNERTTGSGATLAGGLLNPVILSGSNLLDGSESAAVLKKAKIASFLSIEIMGVVNAPRNTSVLKISVPTFNTSNANKVNTWDTLDKRVRKMVEVKSVQLRQVFPDLDRPFEAVLVFYIPDTDLDFLDKTKRKIYFKIYEGNDKNIDSNTIPIYDSKQDNIFYPEAFFTGTAPDTGALNADQIAARVNSQIPFSILASAQVQNEGFEILDYKGFKKDANGADGFSPNCILATYGLDFSDDLGEIVGSLSSETLFPNVCEMDARFFYFNDVIAKWRNDSFDIYLNGLPIKNFKNKQSAQDGGYSKSLLASVPVPFLTGNTTEGQGADFSILTGLYQPTIKNVLKLNNQKLSTNVLNVEIKETTTEVPAKQLHQAHICFTITDENITEIE